MGLSLAGSAHLHYLGLLLVTLINLLRDFNGHHYVLDRTGNIANRPTTMTGGDKKNAWLLNCRLPCLTIANVMSTDAPSSLWAFEESMLSNRHLPVLLGDITNTRTLFPHHHHRASSFSSMLSQIVKVIMRNGRVVVDMCLPVLVLVLGIRIHITE